LTILVTGGAGFIGSNFVLDWLDGSDEPVVTLDALTYAAHPHNLARLAGDRRHLMIEGDIGDKGRIKALLDQHAIRAVVNFAAESHVDRSIAGPEPFFATNVMGTLGLLEAVRCHLGSLSPQARAEFRFVHVSTDEVFGTLEPAAPAFAETHPYLPNSPYAASKAASDHMVRAFRETYGLPAIITNCSNNYGPRQFPEKLIPLVIHNALGGKALPIYGDGLQRRDWLYVADHCSALRVVLERGVPGETYNVGGNCEMANIAVVGQICAELDRLRPRRDGLSYASQIEHVRDRLGHDRRYAIDANKIRKTLGWTPAHSFETGIASTVEWYLDNPDWVAAIAGPAFKDWMARQYA
jgi:dTDP-glucose 4,6-dehydratase